MSKRPVCDCIEKSLVYKCKDIEDLKGYTRIVVSAVSKIHGYRGLYDSVLVNNFCPCCGAAYKEIEGVE